MFTATLARVVEQVEGAVGAAVLNYDGLTIEAVNEAGVSVPPDAAEADYASVCKQLLGMSDALELGDVTELTVEGAERTTLVRVLSPHYIVALRVRSGAMLGKGRFQLRVAAPELAREL